VIILYRCTVILKTFYVASVSIAAQSTIAPLLIS
jgi:hypothetical protein